MAPEIYTGPPGLGTERESVQRKLLLTDQGAVIWPRGKLVDGDNARDPLNTGDLDVLRAGMVMGKITASDLLGASIIGKTGAGYTSGTSLTLVASAAVEMNRRFGGDGTAEVRIVGAASNTGTTNEETITHSAINTTTGVVTITALSNDYIAGSLIIANDGCEDFVGLVGDGSGLKVTDIDSANVDAPLHNLVVGGVLDVGRIINYPAAAYTTLITWIKGEIRAKGLGYVFSDDLDA